MMKVCDVCKYVAMVSEVGTVNCVYGRGWFRLYAYLHVCLHPTGVLQSQFYILHKIIHGIAIDIVCVCI